MRGTSGWLLETAKKTANMAEVRRQQPFAHLFVLDFEATCDSPRQTQPQEIIEFPCLRMDTKTWEVDSVFHR